MLQPASRAHLVGICEMKREEGRRKADRREKKHIALSGKGLANFAKRVADPGGLRS